MDATAQSARIVVIGAGFAGASTAWALAERGLGEVLLIDKESTLGVHASGRNAAMCRQLVEHDEFCALSIEGCEFLHDPPAGFCEHPLVSKSGSLLVAQDDAQLEELTRRARSHQLEVGTWDAAALTERYPFLRDLQTSGALFFPRDGVIDVHALLLAFVAGARERGVTLRLGCEAMGFSERSDGVVVHTNHGDILCRQVVDAAGAWAGRIGDLTGSSSVPPLRPMRRHLFVSDATRVMEREDPFLWYLGDEELYLRPEGKGLLMSACDETEMEPCDAVVAEGANELLADRMSRTAPELSELRIAHSWACLRTFTEDRLPYIGWDRELPWLFWVAGLGGHGATSSPAVGRRAAELILSKD